MDLKTKLKDTQFYILGNKLFDWSPSRTNEELLTTLKSLSHWEINDISNCIEGDVEPLCSVCVEITEDLGNMTFEEIFNKFKKEIK
jgi:hypothetical protein